MTGRAEHDSQARTEKATAMTGRSGHDAWDRTAEAGQSGQVSLTGHPGTFTKKYVRWGNGSCAKWGEGPGGGGAERTLTQIPIPFICPMSLSMSTSPDLCHSYQCS
jgi:hypothetical protein